MKKLSMLAAIFLVLTASVFADAKEIARAEIAAQYKLIRKGETEKLKQHFTDRLKDRITVDKIARAQKEIKSYPLSALVHTVIEGEYQGKKTIKIKMKNGRTLTTLVQEGDTWLADSLWFK